VLKIICPACLRLIKDSTYIYTKGAKSQVWSENRRFDTDKGGSGDFRHMVRWDKFAAHRAKQVGIPPKGDKYFGERIVGNELIFTCV